MTHAANLSKGRSDSLSVLTKNLMDSYVAETDSKPVEALASTVSRLLEACRAEDRVAWAVDSFRQGLMLSTSFGIQSAVMLHLVTKAFPEVPVVFIDTGYLFPETYVFASVLTQRLRLNLKTYTPLMTPARQEALYGRLWEQGVEGLTKYGLINKVEPMDRALKELGSKAWMSGVRRAQSRARMEFQIVMMQNRMLKIAPILDWSDQQIGEYIAAHDLPEHPLRKQGYVSVGDWHSTKPLSKEMTAKETRFNGVKRECGLHERSNIPGYRI